MASQIQHFLLVFDHTQGKLLEETSFGFDSESAVAAYAHKEREFGDRKDIEVVLVGSDSLATVRITHANYYDGSVALPKVIDDLITKLERSIAAYQEHHNH
ncbi:MAG TPA: hypothetical protein VHC63_01230 [Acidimicrobiales bacterium]|nr:hypothetical protein [Acidimicrobiales bacterium]